MNIRDITFENHFSPNFSRVDIGITLHPILVITRFIHVEIKKWERQLPNDKCTRLWCTHPV